LDQKDKDTAEYEQTKSFGYEPAKQPRPEKIAVGDSFHKPEKPEKKSRTYKDLKGQLLKDPKFRKVYYIRYFIIFIGILILLSGTIISYQNFQSRKSTPDSMEKDGYEFIDALITYEGLKSEIGGDNSDWDANKFLKLTTEDIQNGMQSKIHDLNYVIEVQDVSSFPINYNRTIQNGHAWSNQDTITEENQVPDNSYTISRHVNIYVSSEEVHLARVSVTIWE
jgi:hypothetical protein